MRRSQLAVVVGCLGCFGYVLIFVTIGAAVGSLVPVATPVARTVAPPPLAATSAPAAKATAQAAPRPPATTTPIMAPVALAEPPPTVAAAPPPEPPAPTAAAPRTQPAPRAAAPKPAPTKPAAPERSPEVLLAMIQHALDLPPTDPRVRVFAQQLDRLEAKCTEDRGKLADLTAGANKIMADRGVTEPILNTVSGVATATEGLPSERECADVFVAYAITRLGGLPGAAPKPQR